MLNIYYSNKLEALSSQLASILKADPLPPLQSESILVESSAMEYWLTKQITCQMGISANIEFPYPASFVWQLFRLVKPELPEVSSFDRTPLALRLYHIFDQIRYPDSLTSYLKKMPGEKQRFAFACHVADLFDQYQIYRPDVLQKWKAGELTPQELSWQSILWQKLTVSGEASDPDRAEILEQVLQRLHAIDVKKLPLKRLQVFAVSSFPQSYLQLLHELSKLIEVNVFVLSPSAEYWLDSKLQKDDELEGGEEQNDLLLLLARQNQNFMRQLVSVTQAEVEACYVETVQKNLLHDVQNQMTRFIQSPSDKQVVDSKDNSIHINACHHAMREVQLLHDYLLDILENNPTISVSDIAVLVPDVDSYAPYFHAVFQGAGEGLFIPYSVAETKQYTDQPVKRIMLDLLRLPDGNFRHSDVLAILQEPLIKELFQIEDIELVQDVLQELNIHFALSDSDWEQFGEQVVSFSFEHGADRILKSFAFNDRHADPSLIAGVIDNHGEQLGRVLYFVDSLSLIEKQRKDRTIAGHCQFILQVLQKFFVKNSTEELYEVQQVKDSLEKLIQFSTLANPEHPIGFDEFVLLFEKELASISMQQTFKEHTVNIASLLPMRSIPFKVVCVLGMNDGQYPVPRAKDNNDLLALYPKVGDRNRLDEQRYLFLQALLSARDYFYASYLGNSVIDNAEKFPSLLLRELIEFIDNNFCLLERSEPVSAQILQHQALQPFSESYFSSDKFFSYQHKFLRQALALRQQSKQSEFFDRQVNDASIGGEVKNLVEVQRIFVNPSRILLESMDVYLGLGEAQDLDVEAFKGDGLSRYHVFESLFEQYIKAVPEPEIDNFVEKGLLPQAAFAELEIEQYQQDIDAICHAHDSLGLSKNLTEHQFKFSNEKYCLSHTLKRSDEVVSHCIAALAHSLRGKHFIQAWLQHVFVCACQDKPFMSYLFSVEEVYCIKPVRQESAQAMLSNLMQLALSFTSEKSWFFVNSSFALQKSLWQEKSEDESFKAFYKEFESSSNQYFSKVGEGENPYHRLIYQAVDVNEQKILELAEKVFQPLFESLELLDEGGSGDE